MRTFDYSSLASRSRDGEILGLVAQIHEFKGRQEIYLKQKPAGLDRLIEIAKIQSTEASNEVENSIKQLVEKGLLVKHGSGRSTFYTRSDSE